MTDAYYELLDDADPLGERFAATDLVISTWSSAIQHGGPVSALLVRGLERFAQRGDTRLSRVAIDLLGPVPVTDQLWLRSAVERPGRQIELISAEMLALGPDGTPRAVARASGWRLQKQDTHELEFSPAPELPPLARAEDRNLHEKWERNYLHSLDWRWLTDVLGSPGQSWIRPNVDLVLGETMTPTQSLFAVADNANGIGSRIDVTKWTFLNNDLVVHLHRVPEGEWTGIHAQTSYGPDGIGTTLGTLFDQRGAVAHIQQSVLVRRRPPRH